MRGPVVRRIAALAVPLVVAALAGCTPKDGIDAPVAAVMDTKGKVALVDLDRGVVVDTLQMSSWTDDICADRAEGTFVTAQSGGLGNEGDQTVGVIGIRPKRFVRYMRLKEANPGGIEHIRPGRVLVDHGLEDSEGMYSCIVDTKAMKVVREGHVRHNNQPLMVAGGAGWSMGVEMPDGVPVLTRVDLETLESTRVARGGSYMELKCETPYGIAGWLREDAKAIALANFSKSDGRIESSVTVDFKDGGGEMACIGDRLVAVDYDGTSLDYSGCQLVVFNARTLERERAIPIPGAPTDIAAWRDKVVVVSYEDQVLRVVDPETGTIEKTVKLPPMTLLHLVVEVLDS